MSIPDEVADFFSKYPKHTYKRAKQLILIGDQVHTVFYIESGRIDQYDIGSNGDKVVVNTFGVGAFTPMSSVLNDRPSDYFFEVASKTAVIREAPAAEVLAFLHASPRVTLDLLGRVYRGVDGVLGRLTDQMSGSARDQVWRQLMIVARRFGNTTDGSNKISIEMTENQLAQQTGLARETVSRELKKLKTSGIVELPRQGEIVVALEQSNS